MQGRGVTERVPCPGRALSSTSRAGRAVCALGGEAPFATQLCTESLLLTAGGPVLRSSCWSLRLHMPRTWPCLGAEWLTLVLTMGPSGGAQGPSGPGSCSRGVCSGAIQQQEWGGASPDQGTDPRWRGSPGKEPTGRRSQAGGGVHEAQDGPRRAHRGGGGHRGDIAGSSTWTRAP